MQIIDDPGLSSVLGTGLGKGLRSLAEGKMAQMKQREVRGDTLKALTSLGYSEQDASNLSSLHPEIIKEIVKAKVGTSKAQGQEETRNINTLFNMRKVIRKGILEGTIPDYHESKNPQSMQKLQSIMSNLQQQGYSPEDIELIFADKLDDKVAGHLMKKAKGNAATARSLAAKFGLMPA